MRAYVFYSVILAFFIGVAVGILGLPVFPITALLLGLAFILLVWFWHQSSDRMVVLTVLLILLAAAGGLLRAGSDINQPNESVFNTYVNQFVTISGTVTTVPELTASGQNFITTISKVANDQHGTTTGKSRAVVYAGSFPELNYGDTVRLSGQFSKPSRFQTDAGRMFNYPQYLARQEVFYEVVQPTITVTGEDKGNPVKGLLASLREQLLDSLHNHIPDPHAALTGGVLLGAEDALGESLETSFRQTGLIHIVVLSGYNVTIVAVAIAATLLFFGLPLFAAMTFAGIGIALFALLVGLTPTVVRASIMAIIALFARISGRQYEAGRGLAIATFFMVLVNPHILVFDPSFQLSVVATAGLIQFGDRISNWLSFVTDRFGIREAATATIAAQIAVAPLLIFYTGQLSVVSFLANLLVLPVVPILMAFGVATAVLGLLFNTGALPFASGAYFISEYIFSAVNWLANLPFSTANIGPISIVYVLIAYGFFALVAVFTANNSALKPKIGL